MQLTNISRDVIEDKKMEIDFIIDKNFEEIFNQPINLADTVL